VQNKLTKDTPKTKEIKQIVAQLGQAAREALAEARLQAELVKELRTQLSGPAKSTKDRRHLSKARVITAEDVAELFEKMELQEAEKLAKQNTRRNKRLPGAEPIPKAKVPKQQPRERVRIVEEPVVHVFETEEDYSDTDTESHAGSNPVSDTEEEETVNIVEEIALPTPECRQSARAHPRGSPKQMKSRFGRVVRLSAKAKEQ